MRRLTTILAVLVLATVACGEDDDEAAPPTVPTTTTTTRSPQVQEYCGNSLAIETSPEPDIDFESMSESQQREAVKKHARDTLLPLVNKIKTGYVPPEISADAAVFFGAFEKLAQTGDFEAFETETETADVKVHSYDLANCGWEKVDVTAVDYAFQGVPATLKAGTTSFDLRNTGKELHEMAIVRKKPGVTLSFDDILKKDEKEVQKDVDDVASGFAEQGKTDYGVATLTAGDYAMLCFIPVGTTSEDTKSKGAPHFTQGMKSEFKVA